MSDHVRSFVAWKRDLRSAVYRERNIFITFDTLIRRKGDHEVVQRSLLYTSGSNDQEIATKTLSAEAV